MIRGGAERFEAHRRRLRRCNASALHARYTQRWPLGSKAFRGARCSAGFDGSRGTWKQSCRSHSSEDTGAIRSSPPGCLRPRTGSPTCCPPAAETLRCVTALAGHQATPKPADFPCAPAACRSHETSRPRKSKPMGGGARPIQASIVPSGRACSIEPRGSCQRSICFPQLSHVGER